MRSSFQIHGQPEPPVALLAVRAGPLALLYDPTSGMIRRIKLGEREVLRGIYAAVRDHNWGTVPGTIRETRREIEADSFCIEFAAAHQQADIDFVWHGRILGTADGEIYYDFTGEARSSFRRNRIGFCVLHPIAECAGTRARQTRTDGSVIDCRFPDLIEPQIFGKSSFQNLQAVAHEIAPEVWAEVAFSGDIFEMEDQRNWTDASFKTYCTPLALPFPVEIKHGTRPHQSITLRLTGIKNQASQSIAPPHVANEIAITIPSAPTGLLPQIGLSVASHGKTLTKEEAVELRGLKLSHLRADIRLSAPDHLERLKQAIFEAETLNANLELALHLPANGEAQAHDILALLESHKKTLGRILALHEGEAATTPQTLSWTRMNLGKLNVPIGAGSDSNFCELNRDQALGRLELTEADFLFWSMNPQVHAFDHMSIMETLEAQAATVRSARALGGDRQLVVSPVTLKQRFNPVATNSNEAATSDELPPQVDPRQLSDFAAAWTLGSIATLAASGVNAATYYETTGWRGIMERASGSPCPEKFPAQPGEKFSVYRVFESLAGFTHCASANSSDPNRVIALSLFMEQSLRRILFANLTATDVQLKVQLPDGRQQALKLEAYAVVSTEHHT